MHAHKNAQSDRQALAATTPLDNKTGHWWRDRGLLKLNLLLFIPLMSEYVQGYDASLINNVQQLKTWQNGELSSPNYEELTQIQSCRIPSSKGQSLGDSQCILLDWQHPRSVLHHCFLRWMGQTHSHVPWIHNLHSRHRPRYWRGEW